MGIHLLVWLLTYLSSDGSATQFPEDFLWGSATSAYQIEGGIEQNDWVEWERAGHAREPAGIAVDHYHRFREDLALAKNLGHNAFRFSIEWSRVEPEEGRFDENEIAHYKAVLREMHVLGLEPIVTLHHFTNPLWFARSGGWLNPTSPQIFERYARRMAREFSSDTRYWLTFNEPSVVALMGYILGEYPPGMRDPNQAAEAMANLLLAHAESYHAIKEEDPTSLVSFAHTYKVIEPDRWWHPLDRWVADLSRDAWNNQVLEALLSGVIHLHVPFQYNLWREAPRLRGAWDFSAVNYYTRDFVRFDLSAPGGVRVVERSGLPRSDLGWEIYPDGLGEAIEVMARFKMPVFVTESGLADAEDRFRPSQICSHVAVIGREIEAGVPVLGYLHWSLLDNFEWTLGFGPRFGLIGVDRENGLVRTPRASAWVLKDLAQSRGQRGCDFPSKEPLYELNQGNDAENERSLRGSQEPVQPAP